MRADDHISDGQAHLSEDELRRIVGAVPGDRAEGDGGADVALHHIQSCEICRLRGEVVRRGGWANERREDDVCPGQEAWYAIAGETAMPQQSQAWLTHAANCADCAKKLNDALEVFSAALQPDEEEAIARLATSRPKWPREFARRLALDEQHQAAPRKRSWWDWRLAVAAAAMACCVILLVQSWYFTSPLYVESKLRAAYAANGALEYRLPGAPYVSPEQVSVLRNSADENPQAAGALSIADDKLVKNPNSVRWLDLRGRSKLLTGGKESLDQAVTTLEKAVSLDGSNVEVLNDLSVAYARRWRAASRAEDLQKARSANEEARKLDPNNEVAQFNRGLILDEFGERRQAVEAMKLFLAEHSTSAWVPAAKRKLNDWSQSISEHSTPLSESVGEFLRQHRDPELYVETAVRLWLPHRDDAATRAALGQLASEMAEQHGDRWLQEVLLQPYDEAGVQYLSTAVDENLRGDYSGALRSAQLARDRLEHSNARAAASRAEFEKLYSVIRMMKSKSCRADSDELIQNVQDRSFPYIEAQALLELANCEDYLGEFEKAVVDARRAGALAGAAKLRIVKLRALGFEASAEADMGNPDRAWVGCLAGLREYWTDWAPAMRANQFLVDMELLAQADADWPLAQSFQEEDVATIESDQDKDLRALAHFRLARLAVATGDNATADREFHVASQLFHDAPDPATAQSHELESRVGLASIQLRRGDLTRAQENLIAVDRMLRENHEAPYYLQVQYQGARGDIARAQGRQDVAEAAYNEGVRIAEAALPGLTNPEERLRWSAETEHGYRELASILIASGDTDAAWRLWQIHCSAALGIDPAKLRAALESRAELPDGAVRLTYLLLGDQISIWSETATPRRYHTVTIDAADLRRDARQLLSLCSTPDSDSRQIHALARKLYQSLLGPVAHDIAAARLLVVQPDVSMPDLPFEVLEEPNGDYLAQRHPIIYSPGAAYDHRNVLGAVTPQTSLVLVGDNQSANPSLPGVGDEMRSFQRVFSGAIELQGREVSLETLLSTLPAVGVLDFVGHGRESFTGAGLVVRDESPESAGLVLDNEMLDSMKLPNLRLAVLSACSTARGRRGLLDPHSLVQSFLGAGTGMVVASRWDVDSESTARLMSAFYQNLAHGQNVPEALSLASNGLRAQANDQPFYWAAFSVYE